MLAVGGEAWLCVRGFACCRGEAWLLCERFLLVVMGGLGFVCGGLLVVRGEAWLCVRGFACCKGRGLACGGLVCAEVLLVVRGVGWLVGFACL